MVIFFSRHDDTGRERPAGIVHQVYVMQAFDFDKFLGLFAALNYIGYATSAPLLNLCFDMTGSYKPIFFVFGGLTIVICITFRFDISAAKREKQL